LVFQIPVADFQESDMNAASSKTPIWKPSARTRMAVDDFVVMRGGPKRMCLAEHEHNEIQIEAHFSPVSLTRKGSLVLPETFHLIPSKKPHLGSWDEGSEVIVLLLNVRRLEIACDELLRRSDFEIPDEIWGSDIVIQSVASVLRREFMTGTNDPIFLEALRTTLSGHLARSFRNSGLRAIRGRLSPSVLRRALEMIEAKLDTGLSIESLAEHCHMGVHRFTQLFRTSTGRSPYQYFLDLRIGRAKHFLKETSLPLAEIAYKLGFASQSHFSTTFRQQTQLTPRQYRQSSR
jgi:AraC family transcriptional regulator